MAVLSWVMMGLAIWHFAIWLPDRFLGGIVGTFLFAGVGSVLGGLALNGFAIPGQNELDVVVVLDGVPGALVALAIAYGVGVVREPKST